MTIALAGVDLFRRIREGLTKKAKALTKLNLLRIIKVACDHHPQHQDLVTKYGLSTTIQELGRQDEAVLVRQVSSLRNGSESAGESLSAFVAACKRNRSGTGQSYEITARFREELYP